jgi:hypothetical protein
MKPKVSQVSFCAENEAETEVMGKINFTSHETLYHEGGELLRKLVQSNTYNTFQKLP